MEVLLKAIQVTQETHSTQDQQSGSTGRLTSGGT